MKTALSLPRLSQQFCCANSFVRIEFALDMTHM